MNIITIAKKVAILRFFCQSYLCLFLMGGSMLFAQNPPLPLTNDFSTPADIANWEVRNLGDSNPAGIPTTDSLWRYTPDGTASIGAYWDGRQAINSLSGGGAIVFNSDFLDNAGVAGAPCDPTNPIISCAPHEGTIESPAFDASNSSGILVKFYQYFRGYNAATFLDVSIDGGNTWDSIQVNQEYTDLPFGGESPERDIVTINITPYVIGEPDARIRFRFRGQYYFWIIDDVFIFDGAPEDVAIEDFIWPDVSMRCILGEEDQVQIKLRNQGSSPQSGFGISFSSFGLNTASGSEVFTDTIMPNETAIFSFSTPADLRELTYIQTSISNVQGDADPSNDFLDRELAGDTCICFDSLGGPYVCNQVLVQFPAGTSQSVRDSVRQKYNAASLLEICGCDTLELWEIQFPFMHPDGTPLFDPEATVPKLQTEIEIEDAGLNSLVNLVSPEPGTIPLLYDPPNPSTSSNLVRVGLLDTGLDFDHPDLQSRFWKNAVELSDEFNPDDDGNCFIHDNWGVNLIHPGTIPDDDHSTPASVGHGTHVGGTILSGAPSCVNTELMVVKVLAQNGNGTLFDMYCGMEYARIEQADIINVSVGYTGQRSSILEKAVSRLNDDDILLVTSAGNGFMSDNDIKEHWPSNFSLTYPNVIAVTSVNDNDGLSAFANQGLSSIDIAARGENVWSTIPGGFLEPKSGTSMAAALVSRASSFYLSSNLGLVSPADIKAHMLATADSPAGLNVFIKDGKRLALNDSLFATCLTVGIEEELFSTFQAYPNPFDEEIIFEFSLDHPSQLEFKIFNSVGQMILEDSNRFSAGESSYTWRSTDLPKGLYIVQLFVDGSLAHSGKWIH